MPSCSFRIPSFFAMLVVALLLVPLVPAADEQGDQVADPGEQQVPGFVLFEPLDKPQFSTPEQVIDYVHEELGPDVVWEWSSCAANVVVVRNAGAWYQPSDAEASYDDLFLLVFRDKVLQFSYGNAEGTEHRTYVKKYGYDQYVDPNVGRSMTPALGPGQYKVKVDLHQSSYKALQVYDWEYNRFGLPSQRLNGKYNRWDVGAVNVHKGGSDWNWSVGCLTIHYARWDSFIKHFDMGQWGRLYVVGDWNGIYFHQANHRPTVGSSRQRPRCTRFQRLFRERRLRRTDGAD